MHCSQLTKVKDQLPTEKRSQELSIKSLASVVRSTLEKQREEMRLKEHQDECRKCHVEKSAITEHEWTEDHKID